MYQALFSKRDQIDIYGEQDYYFFKEVLDDSDTKLQNRFNLKEYYSRNIKNAFLGGLFTLSFIILNSLLFNIDYLKYFFSLPFIALGLYLISLGLKFSGFARYLAILTGLYISSILLWVLFEDTYSFSGVYFFILISSYVVYIYYFHGNTKKGVQATSEIQGFRMYLKTADETSFSYLLTPKHTVELYEELLPYAIALGVAQEWEDKFASVLSHSRYKPGWIVGVDLSKPYIFTEIFTAY